MYYTGETIRILLAEDSPTDAHLAQREIKKTLESCVFHQVDTRQEFLIALKEFEPDLIVSDYSMPQFDGLTALKLALEFAPFTPVIILTGAINEDTAVDCMKAGAVDYVIKEHIKRLGQAVLHALEQKQVRLARHKAEQALRESEERYRTLIHTLPDAMLTVNPCGKLTYASPSALRLFGYSAIEEVLGCMLLNWVDESDQKRAAQSLAHTLRDGSVKSEEYLLRKKDGSKFFGEVVGSCMRNEQGEMSEVIAIVRDISARKQAEDNLRASEALYRARTRELEALFSLSTSLRQAQTPQDMLPILVKEVQRVITTDATAFLRFEEQERRFILAFASGEMHFQEGIWLSSEQGLCSKVLRERIPCVTDDYYSEPARVKNLPYTHRIGPAVFVPLQSEDTLLGVLLAMRVREPESNPFLPEEIRLLTAMGEMTGNALQRAQLFEDLQHTNWQLSQAYDATIEGLSRALDLRDKETEGHTRRVIDLTVKLAEKVGFREPELIQIRRGAFLHDMGKMGVPDAILLKPDKLSDDEWEIMQRHPKYAYDMLYPIEYLRPALDIPYCHHEKWDGTGYPRGLKGEEIPLAARVFAVVDVWDAVTNERTYRLAWTKGEALKYLREQSGKHFDPRIVELFLEMLGDAS